MSESILPSGNAGFESTTSGSGGRSIHRELDTLSTHNNEL